LATADKVGVADVLDELTVPEDELVTDIVLAVPVALELDPVDEEEDDVDVPAVMSLAPQIPLLLTAAPSVDLR
jgi:hypothetical protein